LFTLLGSAVTASWAGPSNGQSARPGHDGAALMCVATPEQTEGPYFVDEHLNRSDIRSDPVDGSVRPGLPLSLQIRVSGIDSDGCRPLVGATVDIWHCDAQGVYSDVSERRFRTLGSRFLRGYQVTDASGSVRFVTIYPGWYPGRTVHIHFKIRTAPNAAQTLQWTSQLYFDDTITDQAHRHGAYPKRERPRTRNGGDDIFQDGGRSLTLALSSATEGYDARFNVGLKFPS
jgi:protocatechuate 3,4-dioxygenase beta subunit